MYLRLTIEIDSNKIFILLTIIIVAFIYQEQNSE